MFNVNIKNTRIASNSSLDFRKDRYAPKSRNQKQPVDAFNMIYLKT